MSDELTEATRLREIVFPDGASINADHGIVKIVVSMQRGEMSMVPWARVEYEQGDVRLINLAHVAVVRLETDK